MKRIVLSQMENHIIQAHKLPTSITNHIDRIQRNFLWGTTDVKRKLHTVGWKIITCKKEDGGLKIQKSTTRNLTLITKLAWRLHINLEVLWANVLSQKYIRNSDLLTTDRHLKMNSKIWCNIKISG